MAHKVFVGCLSFSTSTETLRMLFADVGTVESVAIVTDRDTGRSRGFGFVQMATAQEADAALNRFNGYPLDGRQLKVELADTSGLGGQSRASDSRGGR